MSSLKTLIQVIGPRPSISEIGEQLAWLGSALRFSPFEQDLCSCTPSIHELTDKHNGKTYQCRIDFDLKRVEEGTPNGRCWLGLFRSPVLVFGYPIARRSHGDTGLEMPLNMMAQLVRSTFVNEFGQSLFIKGFSSMLVLTEQIGDMLLWHHFYNDKGARITYTDHNLIFGEDLGYSRLNGARHIIGWCSDVKFYDGRYWDLSADSGKLILATLLIFANLGTTDGDVENSGLRGPHAGCIFEKVSITGGKFVSGGATFAIGIKETPIHIARDANDPIARLAWMYARYVVLWDEHAKRGWLINGASALLHLLKAYLHHCRTGKAASEFLFEQEKFQDSPNPNSPDSAFQVLLNKDNRMLRLWPGKAEDYIESTRTEQGWQRVSKTKQNFILFGDKLDKFCNILEIMMDHQAAAAERSGIDMKMRLRKHLEGWDFRELAIERDPIKPLVAQLPTMGKLWVDFIREIDAVVLFGRHFGDIIRPTQPETMCNIWSRVPPNKYYLAACISDLQNIMDRPGGSTTFPMKLSDKIAWVTPENWFEPCSCKSKHPDKSKDKHSEMSQVLLPTSMLTLPNLCKARRQVSLAKGTSNGAVIFGHHRSWPYWYGEHGPPVEGPLPAESGISVVDGGSNSTSTHREDYSAQSVFSSVLAVPSVTSAPTLESDSAAENKNLDVSKPGSLVARKGSIEHEAEPDDAPGTATDGAMRERPVVPGSEPESHVAVGRGDQGSAAVPPRGRKWSSRVWEKLKTKLGKALRSQ